MNLYRLTGLSPRDAQALTMGEVNAWIAAVLAERKGRR